MTLLYTSPQFLDHQTGQHPERAERLVQTVRHLERTGLLRRCLTPEWSAASVGELVQVHDAGYLDELADFAAQGGGRIEEDTVLSRQSFDVARLGAGAAIDAVRRVIAAEDKTALCLVRPPGHHALPNSAMGFCLLGNIALAARAALDELQLNRVLIVDWDVHHGNGTQDMCWTDPRIGFFSSHRWPFYPGTGRDDETGGGPALGTKLNLPLEYGIERASFRDQFRSSLEALASKIRPELVLISAGFDAHRDDPVGSLSLETEDYADLTRYVRGVADAYAGGKIVSVLEGGYNTGVLAGCVAVHLEGLLEVD